jgi:signal peptidase I
VAVLTIRVEGTSMLPSLHEDDNLLADKMLLRWDAPRRGDVVVVLQPNGVPAIKRVIGLPGDTLQIDGAHVDAAGAAPRPAVLLEPAGAGPWRRLDEPYVQPNWQRPDSCCDPTGRDTAAPRPLTLPTGQYFVLGDNRNVSVDSRSFGLVPRDRIVGRVLLRYWPLSRWGSVAAGPTLAPA